MPKGTMGCSNQVKCCCLAVEALEALAIHLVKEILFAGSHIVDEMLRESLLLGERLRLAHGAFRHFDIAAALGGDGPHECSGVVLDLLFHDVVHLAAPRITG